MSYDVKATAFQQQVWQALQTIPIGTTVTYSDIARRIGQPTAICAVVRACATNSCSYRFLPSNSDRRWLRKRSRSELPASKHY